MRLKALREEAGLRQDDIGAAARAIGLSWTQATVQAIEAGKRKVALGEFLLLPTVLSEALDRDVGLAELLSADGPIALADRVSVEANSLRRVLPGKALDDVSVERGATWDDETLDEVFRGPYTTMLNELEQHRVDAVTAARSGHGDAERKAARTLDVPAGLLALGAHLTWGRSLTDERDDRLDGEDIEDPETLRARRGWVTRELLVELRETLAKYGVPTP